MEIAAPGQDFSVALLGASFLFGLRHGIDWDHIAAITDIAASQESPRRGFRLGTLYVLGHGAVVLVLGAVAIALGATIPAGLEAVMGRIVGGTLIVLSVYVFYSLFRYGQGFKMRSRWMLVLAGVRRCYFAVRRLATGRDQALVHHDHEHAIESGFHHDSPAAPAGVGATRTHSHAHSHHDSFADYGTGSSIGVGMLHGIGAETPTQILIFLAAASAGGTAAGLTVLVAFLLGLVLSNTAITLTSSFGFLAVGKSRNAYVALGAFTGVASLVVGTLFVLGQGSALPAFFAG